MTRKEIIDELKNRGYDAIEQDVVKNGVKLQGIALDIGNVKPVVYLEDMKHLTLDEAVDQCAQLFDEKPTPGFDVNEIQNPDFLKEHARIGMQRASNEDIVRVKTDFDLDGIDTYVYLLVEHDTVAGTIKVNDGLMAASGIDYDELVEAGKQNTFNDTVMQSIASKIGFPENDEVPFYVISNADNFKGAGAILNVEKLKEFADKFETKKIIALPASIHEWLILPYDEDTDIDHFSEMVRDINETQVDATEQLSDKAYVIEV